MYEWLHGSHYNQAHILVNVYLLVILDNGLSVFIMYNLYIFHHIYFLCDIYVSDNGLSVMPLVRQ